MHTPNIIDEIVNLSHILISLKNNNKHNHKFFDSIATLNPWFTKKSIINAIDAISMWCNINTLKLWIESYNIDVNNYYNSIIPKKIGLIMAGNIPLVGFHDLISVLISGHHSQIKLSHRDSLLLAHCLEIWFNYYPHLKKKVKIVEKINNVDAVITTGNNNSSRYFKYYFSDIPHIIRHNRKSIAIISKDWTSREFRELGKDIFTYFGLGCRNVSKIFVPNQSCLLDLINEWGNYSNIIMHTKYRNNYDYQKAIFLLENKNHLDTGYLLLSQNNNLSAPVGTINYQIYNEDDLFYKGGTIRKFIIDNINQLQCIVSTCKKDFSDEIKPYIVHPGKTQFPLLSDFADGIDTLSFLKNI